MLTVDPIQRQPLHPGLPAFAIDCPAGVVIHTGDFKVDYTPLSGDAVTDLPTIAEYGRKGVLALLADSTNAERPASPPLNRPSPKACAVCLPSR